MKTKEKAQPCDHSMYRYLREDVRSIVELVQGHVMFSQVLGLLLFAFAIPLAFAVPIVVALTCPEHLATAGQVSAALAIWFIVLMLLFSTQQGKGYPYEPNKLERVFDDVIGFIIFVFIQTPGYVLWVVSLVLAVAIMPLMFFLDILFRPNCPDKP